MSEISDKVRAAGVVGAGGAGFPTHVKLTAQAEIFIVNGAECEPLLRVDQQLMARQAAELVRGLGYGMAATGAKEGIIALKAKYKPAIVALEPLLPANVRLHFLKDIYPAGDEVITIWLATGRRVPPAKRPTDVGVMVNNVMSLINVTHAVEADQPVTLRPVTVTGAVKTPMTLVAPIGTPLAELVARAGGPTRDDVAYVGGGPMMGHLIHDLGEPVTKTTSAIIALPEDHVVVRRHRLSMESVLRIARTVCEQCLLCTELCPRHLIGHELPPHLIVRSLNYNHVGQPSTLLSALTCSECAVCEAYACPVDISPMRINMALKAQMRPQGLKYEGELRPADPMAEYRLVPITRLLQKLAIQQYSVPAPLQDEILTPARVVIKLQQHIGAPAQAVVREGDQVKAGQLIGEIPEGSLGARIHASIDGTVTAVTPQAVTIRR